MIRILFLDTSALLSFFVSDQGTPTMRWLMSSDNKAHGSTRYVINNQVIKEFETELESLVTQGEIKQTTADNILTLFNTHYKKHKFKVTGKDASIQATMDGMYNFLGGISRPILVTSNKEQTTKMREYSAIDPQNMSSAEITLTLQNRKIPKEINTCKKTSAKTDSLLEKLKFTSLYARCYQL